MTANTWGDVKFLTIYELARIMRISKMSAYRLVHTGELEAIRVGRSYRIPEQAVVNYMRGAAFTPTGMASLNPGTPPAEGTGGERAPREQPPGGKAARRAARPE
jgi:excisionase family DNA binding protein